MSDVMKGHDWTFKEFSKWDGEPDHWCCTRCDQELEVPRDKTPQEVAKEQGLEDCDQRVLKEVMLS